MSTVSEKIDALHREFGTPGHAMTVEDFNRRLGELLREERAPATKAAPTPASAAPAKATSGFMTWKGFLVVMEPLLEEIAKAYKTRIRKEADRIDALEARLAALESARAKDVEAGNANVVTMNSLERRLSRHAEHLSRLETKLRTVERGTER